MGEGFEDKKLYSYKQALSQPYWIQRLNDDFSLPSPIKFSRIVYFVLLFGILYYLTAFLLQFLPIGPRLTISGMLALTYSETFSNLEIDGKALVFYIIDYLKYWWKYGRQAEKIYVNKGNIYQKPSLLTRRKEKNEIR